jgi:hypothetical protein
MNAIYLLAVPISLKYPKPDLTRQLSITTACQAIKRPALHRLDAPADRQSLRLNKLVSVILMTSMSLATVLLCLSAVGLAQHGEPNNHGQLAGTCTQLWSLLFGGVCRICMTFIICKLNHSPVRVDRATATFLGTALRLVSAAHLLLCMMLTMPHNAPVVHHSSMHMHLNWRMLAQPMWQAVSDQSPAPQQQQQQQQSFVSARSQCTWSNDTCYPSLDNWLVYTGVPTSSYTRYYYEPLL